MPLVVRNLRSNCYRHVSQIGIKFVAYKPQERSLHVQTLLLIFFSAYMPTFELYYFKRISCQTTAGKLDMYFIILMLLYFAAILYMYDGILL